MPCGAQAIHRIAENVESDGPVAPEGEPVRHPAIACAQIENSKRAAGLLLYRWKHGAFEMAPCARPNRPLRLVPMRQILERQGSIVCRIDRSPALSAPHAGILLKEPAPH